MLKTNFTFFLICILGISAFGQRETSSPYSRYGFGDLYSNSLYSNQSMGGAGIALKNPSHINFDNPASHSAINKERFIFETGVGFNFRTLEQGANSFKTNTAGLEYFGCGFPIIENKWSSAFGILPFSSVGYSITNTTDIAEFSYTGKGGITQFVWGNSFQAAENFTIGFHARYLFGKNEYISKASLLNNESSYSSLKNTSYSNQGVIWDFGIQYEYPISDIKKVTFGITYRDKQTIGYEESTLFAAYKPILESADFILDTVYNTLTKDLRTDLPQQIGFGIGYTIQDKLQYGLDITTSNWKNIYVYGNHNSDLTSTISIESGIEYTPNYRSNSYFKTIPYKLGFHYTVLPVTTNTNGTVTSPIDYGISFGTDLLLQKTGNIITLACEAGKRGDFTIENSLQESYFIAKFALTLQEKWFFKRKID